MRYAVVECKDAVLKSPLALAITVPFSELVIILAYNEKLFVATLVKRFVPFK